LKVNEIIHGTGTLVFKVTNWAACISARHTYLLYLTMIWLPVSKIGVKLFLGSCILKLFDISCHTEPGSCTKNMSQWGSGKG
jgi:hypothetical protein